MLSSSIQATLAGRFGNSEYGRSKKAGEELFFDYAKETGAKVAVYRFPNLMGHSRPKYNSAVSTFCWQSPTMNRSPLTTAARSWSCFTLMTLWKGCLTCWKARKSIASLTE